MEFEARENCLTAYTLCGSFLGVGLFGPLNFSVYLEFIHCPSAPLLMAKAGPCEPCLLSSFDNWLLVVSANGKPWRDQSKKKQKLGDFSPSLSALEVGSGCSNFKVSSVGTGPARKAHCGPCFSLGGSGFWSWGCHLLPVELQP